jgi:hypothetical protein
VVIIEGGVFGSVDHVSCGLRVVLDVGRRRHAGVAKGLLLHQRRSVLLLPTSRKRGNRPGPFGPSDPVPEPGPIRRD